MAAFNFFDDVEMFADNEGSSNEQKFDDIIGTIEDIVISQEFQLIQRNFMEKYYREFEDTEENKFIYTDIFQEYGQIIERYIVEGLKQKIPGFSIETFVASLQAHKEEIIDEIFDMFLTFTDFLAFKEMFIDYRADKEGKNIELMDSVVVHSIIPNNCSAVTSS